jgi:hypothetical protein
LIDDGGANEGELSISFNLVLISSDGYKCKRDIHYFHYIIHVKKRIPRLSV